MDTGTHQLVLERETVYDTIRRKWAQHVTGIFSRSAESSRSAYPSADTNLSSCSDNNFSLQCRALKGESGRVARKTLVSLTLLDRAVHCNVCWSKGPQGQLSFISPVSFLLVQEHNL